MSETTKGEDRSAWLAGTLNEPAKPKFEVPVLMRPWVSKIATAGLAWLVVWLGTKGIEVQLPLIQAEVQALRQEVKEMRHEAIVIAAKLK